MRMGLEEQVVTSSGHGSADQRRDVLGITSARSGGPSRALNAVGAVEDDRNPAGLTDHTKRPHVHDQVPVAEERAPLGDEHLVGTSRPGLLGDGGHFLRGHPLPLLHVHRPTGIRRRRDQVGLSAQKRRDLEHIDDLRRQGGLLRRVNVRESG